MIEQIFSLVVNAKSGCIATIETMTKVNIPQKWGLGKNVSKYCKQQVKVGCSYSSCVNIERGREGLAKDFESLSLRWGEWLVPNRVITHKGGYYYRFYPHQILDTQYYVDGQKATAIQLDILKAFFAAQAEKESSRQGIEKEIKVLNPKEENILSLKVGGQTYQKQVTEVAAIVK